MILVDVKNQNTQQKRQDTINENINKKKHLKRFVFAGGGTGGIGLVTKSIFSIRALLNTISLKDSTSLSSDRGRGSPGK